MRPLMRPMKLAGDELIFGQGALAHLEAIKSKKMVIVLGDDIVYKNGVMDIVEKHLKKAGTPFKVYMGIEPDPKFSTVLKGAKFMLEEKPDFILAIGGGSTMDAAKAMWIYYEHPEIKDLETIADKSKFPKLRGKARFGAIPTTAGTASEVSRSIVITDDVTGYKHGIGNMEMMPDVAILDPVTTLSKPRRLTIETGFDALSHALEAFVSSRANVLSDVLARFAIKEIFEVLPQVINDLKNIELRERMLNASLIAGLSFTNVSLGVVHSISHSLGGVLHLPHGTCNAILLPHVVKYNSQDVEAKKRYDELAKMLGKKDMVTALNDLTKVLEFPKTLSEFVKEEDLMAHLDEIADLSAADGCTKTNPICPTKEQFKKLILLAFHGEK
ncbi:MAG: Aldehyde-alcohol dehydrogenase [Tenericutes bacterium ADurb.Bin239]|nr:MAG: Aldehyde-alcohol dehydrogenase [Tenericutes bacterium ADurb.Bin239]